MAYLTKEVYQGKAEYAAARMAESAEMETLTREQHEALEWLCSIRHEIHCGQESVYCSGSADYDRFTDAVSAWAYSSDAVDNVRNRLQSVGLPAPTNLMIPDLINDDEKSEMWESGECFVDGLEDELKRCLEVDDTDDWHDECLGFVIDRLNCWNKAVESYLKDVDTQHGTKYCPTGATRIY